MFFSILGGKGTYIKATKQTQDYAGALGGAAGAAGALKQVLMGFDEINALSPSGGGGGGGGGGLDYGAMFEEVPVESWLADMIESGNFSALGASIAEKVNAALGNIPWSKAYAGAQKAAQGLTSLINGFFGEIDPKVIGEFVWTGFDYLGEPTPYDEYWPSRSSYFGIYDLAGLPKDRVWLYRAHWAPEKETLHILPHWTWKGREGEVTPVFVYTNYPEAELFVNGVSQGRRKRLEMTMDEYLASAHKRKVPWGTENMSDPASAKNRIDRYRLRWMDVVYEPGEIRVVAYDRSGKPAAEKTLCTAGKPHHIVLEADRTSMPAQPVDSDGKALDTPSLTYYTVNVVDRNGNLCPDASNQLSFKVDGASARFNSCCNGDATSLEPFTKPTMKAFHGKLVVVVESTPTAGTSKLTVTGKGLKEARTEIVVTAQ